MLSNIPLNSPNAAAVAADVKFLLWAAPPDQSAPAARPHESEGSPDVYWYSCAAETSPVSKQRHIHVSPDASAFDMQALRCQAAFKTPAVVNKTSLLLNRWRTACNNLRSTIIKTGSLFKTEKHYYTLIHAAVLRDYGETHWGFSIKLKWMSVNPIYLPTNYFWNNFSIVNTSKLV